MNLRIPYLALAIAALISCSPKFKQPPLPSAIKAVGYIPVLEELSAVSVTDTIYTIGPFDRLGIAVWRYPDFSGERTIKEDGSIFMPGVGNIDISDLTLRQAQEKIDEKLKTVLREPEIDIAPVEVRSKLYSVLGAVSRPGRYPIFRRTDLLSALATAGGSTPGASLDRVYLSRNGKVYTINLRTILTRGAVDIFVARGDILYVPSAEDSQVFVLGYVNKSGAFPAAFGGLDVPAAIASAGGFKVGAASDSVAVLRSGPDGLTGYIVDMDAVLKGEGDISSLILNPGDIVYVPPTGLGSWNEIITQISPTISLLLFQPLKAATDYFVVDQLINR